MTERSTFHSTTHINHRRHQNISRVIARSLSLATCLGWRVFIAVTRGTAELVIRIDFGCLVIVSHRLLYPLQLRYRQATRYYTVLPSINKVHRHNAATVLKIKTHSTFVLSFPTNLIIPPHTTIPTNTQTPVHTNHIRLTDGHEKYADKLKACKIGNDLL